MMVDQTKPVFPDWLDTEADFAHALSLLAYAVDRVDGTDSPRWRRDARMLVARHADVIERHSAPVDWRRGGAQ